jgi:phage shock protein C
MSDERLDDTDLDDAPSEGSEGEHEQVEFDLNAGSGEATPYEPDEPRRLRRSAHDRMVSGVAGGIAEYIDIDPVFVRIAFVLGTIFGAGLGLLIYVVAWIVMPGGGAPVVTPRRRRPRRGRRLGGSLVFGLLLIAIGAAALLATTDALDPGGDWILVGLAALLVVIGAAILVQSRRGLDGGLVFWGVAITIVLTIALQVDLSFESGFGERNVSADRVEDLQSTYSHAFGSLRVDLRDLEVPEGQTERLSIDIAFGDLVVDLPRDIAWRVEADAVFGSVDLPGRELSGIANDGVETSDDWETATSRIEIDISAAFGSAEVR